LTSPERMLSAFEAVIPGGLGPIRGTLAGVVVLGISQAAGNRWLQWLVLLQTES
jgi:branched-subunit amino acid ABC-type transport system permease component